MDRGEPAAPDAWVTVRDVDRAARQCLRRKGGRPDAIQFRMRYGQEVLALTERLVTGRYRPEPGIVFVTERPKLREVHAAVFRDRVVHHLLHDLLAPRFEAAWSPRSFACRVGYGTHAALRCLQRMVHDVSRRGERPAFALQLDVASFFPTVHKPTLLGLLARGFSAEERRGPLFALVRAVLLHDPTRAVRRCGPAEQFARVPLHKRLGSFGPEVGLPIGNLTSQFFAGVYLSPLDHFIERTLGLGAYVRYMDDILVLHTDRERLACAEARIGQFLRDRLRLEVRAGSTLRPVSEGVDFVGYVVRPRYTLARRRVLDGLARAAQAVETALAPVVLEAGQSLALGGLGVVEGPCSVQAVEPSAIEHACARWSSYLGHLRHARAWRALARVRAASPGVRLLLDWHDAPRVGVRRRFALPRLDGSFAAQHQRLRQGLRGAILLVQVGARLECRQARDARLVGMSRWRRRGRRWVGCAPCAALCRLARCGLAAGRRLVLVEEAGGEPGLPRRRRVRWELQTDPREQGSTVESRGTSGPPGAEDHGSWSVAKRTRSGAAPRSERGAEDAEDAEDAEGEGGGGPCGAGGRPSDAPA